MPRTIHTAELLDKAIQEIRRLPQDRQVEAAEFLLTFAAQGSSEYVLTSEQIVEVERRLGEDPLYASDAEVEATFRRLLR